MSIARYKCKCCGGGPFTCAGNNTDRCCYSTSSTVTVTWSISGGTSGLATGTYTIPYDTGGGTGYWTSPAAIPGYSAEVTHGDSNGLPFDPPEGIWLITLVGASDNLTFEYVYSGGSWDSSLDGKCCGFSTTLTARHFNSDSSSGEDFGKSTTVTVVINNNKCCTVVTAGGGSKCTKRTFNRACDPDNCDKRCAGCCETYRLSVSNAGAMNGTYDLAKLVSTVDAGASCEWKISLPTTQFIGIQGSLLTIRFGTTNFFYTCANETWAGCPPTESLWSYLSQSGTSNPTIPTFGITLLDCP